MSTRRHNEQQILLEKLRDREQVIPVQADDREEAVAFAEELPSAQAGLYQSMQCHFYNNLDVTGKFVSEDPLRDAPCADMKEAMEYWGYPVADDQTPWLNW